ncbi:class B sortase [Enterococcus bulliens]
MTKKSIRIILLLIANIVLIFSCSQLFLYKWQIHQNKEKLQSVQNIYKKPKIKQSIPLDEEIRPVFQQLHNINPDISGWLTIPGTTIDFPVLHTTDNEFYLSHNYKKEQTIAGSVFKDYRNQNEFFDQNTILYGHYMKNQQMFGALDAYMAESFFKEHPSFDYDTPSLSYTVKIFAVYDTTTDFNYIQTKFSSENEFSAYLNQIKKLSWYTSNVSVDENDRILTLSTCDLDYSTNGRFVIQGKLVQKNK